MFEKILNIFLFKLLAVKEVKDKNLGVPKNILVIRQHNQFGDLLASVALFRAIKTKFPQSNLRVLVSPQNYYAITKNKYIDEWFSFDKKKLLIPAYFIKLYKFLRQDFDLCIVPVTVSVSFTSNLIARISNSKIRIGPRSLDGNFNISSFMFDRLVDLDWRKNPDSHISSFIQEIVRPFGIFTNDFSSSISFDEVDLLSASKFIDEIGANNKKLIGLHIGAGKQPNRWSLKKFIEIVGKINSNYSAAFYITGSTADKEEIDYIKNNLKIKTDYFLNRSIPELAALISKSDLFITNDTGVMHVAGATSVKQVSLFGPTSPENWAPVGKDKHYIKKSNLIDDISIDDVYTICNNILSENNH